MLDWDLYTISQLKFNEEIQLQDGWSHRGRGHRMPQPQKDPLTLRRLDKDLTPPPPPHPTPGVAWTLPPISSIPLTSAPSPSLQSQSPLETPQGSKCEPRTSSLGEDSPLKSKLG